MDARQQFRRMALAAQDRDLTSVAFAVEGEVAQPTIRMHNTAGLNRLLHEGHQTVRRSVRNATHANASDAPALLLRRHDNQGLALRFAAPHTLFRSPHVSLVNLDSSRQLFPARSHHRPPQFVQPTPSRLVTAEPQHALQTEGADAILLAGHPPQSVEPHLQRSARVLKNRPRSQRSLVRTARTLPERGTQPPSSAFPTPGAAEPFRPAHPEKIVTTGFLRSEALLEVRQRARIVFHGLLHYLLWLPESNGYPITPILSGDGLTRQGVLFPRENGGSNPSSPLQPPHGIGAGSELDWERLTLPFTESSELLQIDQRCLPLPDHL